MTVLVMQPGESAVVKEIDGSLRSMQKLVGGLVEIARCLQVQLYDPQPLPVFVICNEEGRLQGLPENAFGCVGTLFFCVAGEEDFEGFDDTEQAQLVTDTINREVYGV